MPRKGRNSEAFIEAVRELRDDARLNEEAAGWDDDLVAETGFYGRAAAYDNVLELATEHLDVADGKGAGE